MKYYDVNFAEENLFGMHQSLISLICKLIVCSVFMEETAAPFPGEGLCPMCTTAVTYLKSRIAASGTIDKIEVIFDQLCSAVSPLVKPKVRN